MTHRRPAVTVTPNPTLFDRTLDPKGTQGQRTLTR
jgi:hypothetical protein